MTIIRKLKHFYNKRFMDALEQMIDNLLNEIIILIFVEEQYGFIYDRSSNILLAS